MGHGRAGSDRFGKHLAQKRSAGQADADPHARHGLMSWGIGSDYSNSPNSRLAMLDRPRTAPGGNLARAETTSLVLVLAVSLGVLRASRRLGQRVVLWTDAV